MSRSTRLLNYFNSSKIYSLSRCTNTLNRRFLSNNDVGFVKPNQNTDYLLMNLKNASTTNSILELVSDHHKIMNNTHLMQALRNLFYLQKSGRSEYSSKELISDPKFKTLCLSLKSHARSINIKETIEALKVMSYIGIPENSTITQILLQLIRQNVNHLSLQQIIFVEYLLKQFKEISPLSEALLIALPIVFEVNLPLKMDRENMQHLCDVLQFVSRKHVANSSLDLIINAIMSHKIISPKEAVSIVWSLCDVKPDEALSPLLHRALRTLVRNHDGISFTDLEMTLTKVAYRTNVFQPYYYNEEFFNLIGDIIIDKDLGFQQALWILVKFNKVGHFHKNLLDYLSRKCDTEENLISTTNYQNIITLVTGFTATEYKPKLELVKFKNDILQNKNLNRALLNINSLRLATNLAILDIYVPKIIETAFSDEVVNKLIKNGSYDDCKHFLALYNAVSAMCDDLKMYLPSQKDVISLLKHFEDITVQNYPLQGALENAFGGKQYILTNCSTKNGIAIQHAIMMRKGGFPVAFNNVEQKYPIILEELNCSTDNQIVAILALSPGNYCFNNGYLLKGLNTLLIRSLEMSGYTVVPIAVHRWAQLADHEKIPYLMRTIREKSDNTEKLYAEGL